MYAFKNMLYTFNYIEGRWGLIDYNWTDLTLSEAESMILNDGIFGYNDGNSGVRISIVCKDGNGDAYYSRENWSWVFEY